MKKIIIFVLLILNINNSWALRCRGQLVYEGDTQEMVVRKCGDPKNKETLSTTQDLFNSAGVRYASVPFLTEIWTYQTSPQDFIHSVYFTNKIVTSITEKLASPGP